MRCTAALSKRGTEGGPREPARFPGGPAFAAQMEAKRGADRIVRPASSSHSSVPAPAGALVERIGWQTRAPMTSAVASIGCVSACSSVTRN